MNFSELEKSNDSVDLLQGQKSRRSDLLAALLINGLVFGFFLLAKTFRQPERNLPTVNERADSF